MEEEGEYERGLRLLESLITGKKRQDGSQWENAFQMMQCYLDKLDLEDSLPNLHAIHVAGTKGKGSTCAMVESILRSCGYRTGLFTSPHLMDVRERIRINGNKVDEESFLKCLFDTYATLAEKNGEDSGKPAYFRFLTLLGFRIFLEQQVDVAVLEVGLGGRLDATNCIREPVVCGVSALGFDHMNVLGYTLPEISREKAGIFKNGVPALTVPQREDAMETLIRVAKEKNVLSLKTVPSLDSYRLYGSKERNIELGLQGEHQAQNAALAVQLAAMWESRHGQWTRVSEGAATRSRMVLEDGILPDEYRKGLENVRWPGRGEIFEDPEAENVTFFVDGAHTPESVDACAAWFSSASSAKSSTAERVVIFNCMEERDPKSLLEPLQERLVEKNAVPSEIMFSPTISSYTKLNQQTNAVDVSWQGRLQATWDKMMEQRKVLVTGKPGSVSCQSSVAPSLHETLRHIRTMSQKLPKNKRLHVLVTGSLYLVGDMLQLLGRSA